MIKLISKVIIAVLIGSECCEYCEAQGRPFSPQGQQPQSAESLRAKEQDRIAVSEAARAQRERYAAEQQAQYQQQIEAIRLQAEAFVEKEYYKTHQPISVHHIGDYKVSDVASAGARIYIGDKDCFVYGLTGVFSDRNYNGLEVVSAPAYTYTTVKGDARRIPAYRVLTAAENAQQQELQVLINQAEFQICSNTQARRKELKQAETTSATKKIFAFRKEQAANDMPSAQYLLGSMYLNGEGTDVDTNLGMQYIYKAATNGSQDAVEFLKKR